MANDDWIAARGGLIPVEYPYGNFRKNWYRLTTSASAVFIGQPMDLDANGQAVPALTGTSTTINRILGPVVGFADDSLGVSSAGGNLPNALLSLTAGPSLPASTNSWVLIADDPDQMFQIQANTDATMTTANFVDLCTFTYRTSSGNTTTGYSTAEASVLSMAVTASGNLQVCGLIPYRNSDSTVNSVGNYAKLRVRIAQHRWGGAPAGAGV